MIYVALRSLCFGYCIVFIRALPFLRNKEDIEALKIYGLTSYVGFVIALIAIENIIITLLSVIPTQAVTQFVIFVDIVVLAVAAHFLLRPGFKGTHSKSNE